MVYYCTDCFVVQAGRPGKVMNEPHRVPIGDTDGKHLLKTLRILCEMLEHGLSDASGIFRMDVWIMCPELDPDVWFWAADITKGNVRMCRKNIKLIADKLKEFYE